MFEGCGRCGRPARSGRSPPPRLARITPSPSSPRAFADSHRPTPISCAQLRLRPTKADDDLTLVHFSLLEYVFTKFVKRFFLVLTVTHPCCNLKFRCSSVQFILAEIHCDRRMDFVSCVRGGGGGGWGGFIKVKDMLYLKHFGG
jgi:hypothetical protein